MYCNQNLKSRQSYRRHLQLNHTRDLVRTRQGHKEVDRIVIIAGEELERKRHLAERRNMSARRRRQSSVGRCKESEFVGYANDDACQLFQKVEPPPPVKCQLMTATVSVPEEYNTVPESPTSSHKSLPSSNSGCQEEALTFELSHLPELDFA